MSWGRGKESRSKCLFLLVLLTALTQQYALAQGQASAAPQGPAKEQLATAEDGSVACMDLAGLQLAVQSAAWQGNASATGTVPAATERVVILTMCDVYVSPARQRRP